MSKIGSNNYKDCYVAFLDILGFKRMESAYTRERLQSVYEEFYGAIEHGFELDPKI